MDIPKKMLNSPAFLKTQPTPVVEEQGQLTLLSSAELFNSHECAEMLSQLKDDKWFPMAPAQDCSAWSCDEQYIPVEGCWEEVHSRLLNFVTAANERRFKFDLNFFESVRVVRYKEGDFMATHADAGEGISGNRKLGVTVTLNTDYEGGVFELVPSGYKNPKTIGCASVYPSFLHHKISPVTKGIRYVLLVYVCGTYRFR